MFFGRVEELVKNVNYQGNYKKEIIEPLMREFNLSERVVYKRIKSYFGCTITNLAQRNRTPSKEEVENAVLVASSKEEARKILGLHEGDVVWTGIFDRVFGVSTFTAAKTKLILKKPNKYYSPTIDDNLSIIISQCIGDGYFDRKRKSIKISHIDWQLDYLKMKVSLFNKAFPESSGLENIKFCTHSQGHKYVSWYSRRLPDKYMNKIISLKKHEMVDLLTPLGLFILYLDDGYLTINEKYNTMCLGIAYSEHYPELGVAIQEHLKSYGYNFNIKKNSVHLNSKPMIASFLKNMIIPYQQYIPNCLGYKINMKI